MSLASEYEEWKKRKGGGRRRERKWKGTYYRTADWTRERANPLFVLFWHFLLLHPMMYVRERVVNVGTLTCLTSTKEKKLERDRHIEEKEKVFLSLRRSRSIPRSFLFSDKCRWSIRMKNNVKKAKLAASVSPTAVQQPSSIDNTGMNELTVTVFFLPSVSFSFIRLVFSE